MKLLIFTLFFTQSFLGANFQRQSPIDITYENTEPIKNVPMLSWYDYWYTTFDGMLMKDNSTVELGSDWGGSPPYLMGGPLQEEYVISSIHWHWGDKDNFGSEHAIDGQRYPLEMHIVTHKNLYKDKYEALKSNDSQALAVVGYLFKIQEIPSPGFTVLGKALDKLKKTDTFQTKFDYRLLGPKYITKYYTYLGSLTTPPYSENVIWIVSKPTLRISRKELAAFRSIKTNGVSLSNHVRDLQPLNERIIYSI